MQRWIKLPNGTFLDANRVVHIGKVESFAKLDEEGNNAGVEYAVTLMTELAREHQLQVSGSRDEISTLIRSILGSQAPAPGQAPAPSQVSKPAGS